MVLFPTLGGGVRGAFCGCARVRCVRAPGSRERRPAARAAEATEPTAPPLPRRPDRRDRAARRRRAEDAGEFAYSSDLRAPGCSGATRSGAPTPTRGSARSTSPRPSRCRGSTPCSPTPTCRARSTTASSSATSPCSRSIASATSASPSRSSPRSIPSRRGVRPRGSRSTTSRSSPIADMERATERPRAAPRAPDPGSRLPRRSSPERRSHARRPPRRSRRRRGDLRRGRLRDRHPGSGVPRARVGPRRSRRRGRRRHPCRDAVAARRPGPDRPLPRAAARAVRVHLAGVGGAFGGREDVSMQIHAALLALHTSRAVKIVYNREESFTGHVHRHPSRIWARHTATRDGRLVSVAMRILLDGGAYASSSTAVCANAAAFACGPYSVPNALLEATVVYTNNPPCGAMRGFGAVQTCFAGEAQMDKLAAALDLDPVELRLPTRSPQGDTLPTGQRIDCSLPTAEVIRAAAALEPPRPEELPRDPLRLPGGAGNTTRGEGVRRGTGFAVGFKNIASRRGSTTTALRASPLRRRLRRGSLRRGGGRPGRHERHPPGRADRARHRRGAARAAVHRHRRVGRLDVGLAADLDGLGRRPRRVPRRARRAGRARRGRSRRRADLPARPTSRSIPRPARSPATGRTSRSRCAR